MEETNRSDERVQLPIHKNAGPAIDGLNSLWKKVYSEIGIIIYFYLRSMIGFPVSVCV